MPQIHSQSQFDRIISRLPEGQWVSTEGLTVQRRGDDLFTSDQNGVATVNRASLPPTSPPSRALPPPPPPRQPNMVQYMHMMPANVLYANLQTRSLPQGVERKCGISLTSGDDLQQPVLLEHVRNGAIHSRVYDFGSLMQWWGNGERTHPEFRTPIDTSRIFRLVD